MKRMTWHTVDSHGGFRSAGFCVGAGVGVVLISVEKRGPREEGGRSKNLYLVGRGWKKREALNKSDSAVREIFGKYLIAPRVLWRNRKLTSQEDVRGIPLKANGSRGHFTLNNVSSNETAE